MVKKYPVFGQSEVSQLLIDSFVQSGSCHVVCEACGRDHISTETGINWEKGEKSRFNANQKRNPEGYIDHDDSVRWLFWEGKQIVIECPCNYAGFLESWIWGRRRSVMNYLFNRATAEKKAADATANKAVATKEIIDKI